jgi:glutathione reductase (NADPH)
VEAKHIVIATGSKPRRLSIEGADLMITSDEVLSERRLPREVVFVGGGVVAVEFSHVYVRAGAKVTILEGTTAAAPAARSGRGRISASSSRTSLSACSAAPRG